MKTQWAGAATSPPAVGRLVARVGAVVLVSGAAVGCSSGETVELTAGGGDATASCIVFDVAVLADMSPAFAGTVVELDDSVATLEVDRWYTGGDAERVAIRYTPGLEALIGTPALELDQRYLITAADGTVNGCGYSGPATPELESAFEQAFGS